MKQAGKYLNKNTVLWIGIFTALLLIVGTFSPFSLATPQFEFQENLLIQGSSEHWQLLANLVRETVQWVRP